jgi:hypothetical protein
MGSRLPLRQVRQAGQAAKHRHRVALQAVRRRAAAAPGARPRPAQAQRIPHHPPGQAGRHVDAACGRAQHRQGRPPGAQGQVTL